MFVWLGCRVWSPVKHASWGDLQNHSPYCSNRVIYPSHACTENRSPPTATHTHTNTVTHTHTHTHNVPLISRCFSHSHIQFAVCSHSPSSGGGRQPVCEGGSGRAATRAPGARTKTLRLPSLVRLLSLASSCPSVWGGRPSASRETGASKPKRWARPEAHRWPLL